MTDAALPPAHAPGDEDDLADGRQGQHDLFGRGMLYVLIWSTQLVVSTIVSPILTRALPQEQFGAIAAVIALFQLLTLFSVLGLDQALEIQRVEDGDDTRARGLIALGLILAFGVALLGAATAPWWAPAFGFRDLTLAYVGILWTAPGASVYLCLSLLQAEDRLARFAVVSLTASAGAVIAGVLALFLLEPDPAHRTALTYVGGSVIAQFVALGLGLLWCRPRFSGLRDTETIRRAFALGLPLAVAGIAQFVLSAADRLIIQRLLGPAPLAQYQVAYTVGNVTSLLLAFTSRAWMPRLKSITSDERRWEVIAQSRDGIYGLLAWVLLGITVSAPVLLRVFAPASYNPAEMTPLVFIVGLGALPVAAAAATSQALITTRHSRPIAWAAGAAAVVKLATTVLGLRLFGLPGAAAATVLALGVQALWQRAAVTRRMPWQRSSTSSLLMLVISVALAGFSTLLPQTWWWNVGRFAVSALCVPPFFGAVIALQRGTTLLGLLRRRAG